MILVLPMLICEVLGYAVWGAVQAEGVHWMAPVVLYSIIDFGQGLGSTAVVAYVVDAHRGNVPEAFAVINFIKNMLAFGCTYFVNSWLAKDGALAVFNVLGSCFLGVCCLTIPLWVFGKRVRSWVARNEFLNGFMRDL